MSCPRNHCVPSVDSNGTDGRHATSPSKLSGRCHPAVHRGHQYLNASEIRRVSATGSGRCPSGLRTLTTPSQIRTPSSDRQAAGRNTEWSSTMTWAAARAAWRARAPTSAIDVGQVGGPELDLVEVRRPVVDQRCDVRLGRRVFPGWGVRELLGVPVQLHECQPALTGEAAWDRRSAKPNTDTGPVFDSSSPTTAVAFRGPSPLRPFAPR